jgi:hypothetical protein
MAALMAGSSGCATKSQTGALVGAGGGAVVGAVIGKVAGNTTAVATYLAVQGVERGRLSAVGYGELQPIASNATADGQQRNRRVEIAIWANDDLKAAARRQAGG